LYILKVAQKYVMVLNLYWSGSLKVKTALWSSFAQELMHNITSKV